MKVISILLDNLNSWFLRLNKREKLMLSFCGACILVFGAYSALLEIQDTLGENERLLSRRTEQLGTLSKALKRYVTLKARLQKIQQTFAKSQMSFKELTDQLDKVLRQNIGANNTYDLKKGGSPSQIGFDYEKQLFTVNVRSLNLEQITKLLFQLEHGDSPLYLGKVDLVKSQGDGSFSATLEIFSIQKAQTPAKPSV